MAKKSYDVTIKQNRDWFFKLILLDDRGRFPLDLTGYKAKLSLRNYENEELVKSIETNEGITITGNTGTILCHLTNSETNVIDFTNNKGKYELVLSKDDTVFELVDGLIDFQESIVEVNP